MNKNLIYTVTTIRHALGAGTRCVGFFHEFENACVALVNNEFDINEMGYYPFAVIEEFGIGFYNHSRKEFWFKWNRDTKLYESIPEKPERFKKICCWGIG